jgi:hypothetical protein
MFTAASNNIISSLPLPELLHFPNTCLPTIHTPAAAATAAVAAAAAIIRVERYEHGLGIACGGFVHTPNRRIDPRR